MFGTCRKYEKMHTDGIQQLLPSEFLGESNMLGNLVDNFQASFGDVGSYFHRLHFEEHFPPPYRINRNYFSWNNKGTSIIILHHFCIIGSNLLISSTMFSFLLIDRILFN
jgi:hypothetical protein